MDFCHLQKIYPTITGKMLDTATKTGPDAEKAALKIVVHETTETM